MCVIPPKLLIGLDPANSTHTHTHARTHTRACAHTHTHHINNVILLELIDKQQVDIKASYVGH